MLGEVIKDCKDCSGTGWKVYSHGSTWRGGIGTTAFCTDQCNMCWGSGSSSRPWPNVKELEQKRKQATEEEVVEWINRNSGCSLLTATDGFEELLRVLEKQERRRKMSPGVDAFWYSSTIRIMIDMMTKLRDAARRRYRTMPIRTNT